MLEIREPDQEFIMLGLHSRYRASRPYLDNPSAPAIHHNLITNLKMTHHVSEVITALQAVLARHGDIEFVIETGDLAHPAGYNFATRYLRVTVETAEGSDGAPGQPICILKMDVTNG